MNCLKSMTRAFPCMPALDIACSVFCADIDDQSEAFLKLADSV